MAGSGHTNPFGVLDFEQPIAHVETVSSASGGTMPSGIMSSSTQAPPPEFDRLLTLLDGEALPEELHKYIFVPEGLRNSADFQVLLRKTPPRGKGYDKAEFDCRGQDHIKDARFAGASGLRDARPVRMIAHDDANGGWLTHGICDDSKSVLKISPRTATQWTSFCVVIMRPEKKITVHFTPAMLFQLEIKRQTAEILNSHHDDPQRDAQLSALAANDSLVQFRIVRNSKLDKDRAMMPCFYEGISQADVTELVDRYRQAGDLSTFQPWEHAIIALEIYDHFDFTMKWDKKEEEAFARWSRFFMAAWNLTKLHGPCWWYKFCDELNNCKRADTDLEAMLCPPWLAKSWKSIRVGGQWYVTPAKRAEFAKPVFMPDVDTSTFVYRMVVQRALDIQNREMERYRQNANAAGKLGADFYAHPHKAGYYLIAVFATGDAGRRETSSPLSVQRDTQIEISAAGGRKWQGTVTDDIFETGASFCAWCRGPQPEKIKRDIDVTSNDENNDADASTTAAAETSDAVAPIPDKGKGKAVDVEEDTDTPMDGQEDTDTPMDGQEYIRGTLYGLPEGEDEIDEIPLTTVRVEFKNVQTTVQRWAATLEVLSHKLERRTGFSPTMLAFQTMTNWMNRAAKRFANYPSFEAAMDHFRTKFGLNEHQTSALVLVYDSEHNVAPIQGPAGTGKSRLLSSILEIQREENEQTLACATTNAAVLQLAQAYLKCRRDTGATWNATNADGSPNLDFVIVAGDVGAKPLSKIFRAHRRSSDEVEGIGGMNLDNDEQELEDAEEMTISQDLQVFWDMIKSGGRLKDSVLADNLYQVRIKQWIEFHEHKDRKNSPYHETVKKWRNARRMFNQATTEGEKLKARRIRDHLDRSLSNDFFKLVKVVFATANSCGVETLVVTTGFRPRTLLFDEAAMATHPDSLTPIAVFKESLVRIVYVGDEKQNKPIVMQDGQNEYFSFASGSLFEALVRPDSIYSPEMLKTQYRQHPELSELPSKTFYGGALKDPVPSPAITEIGLTWRHFLNYHLAGASNKPQDKPNRCRVAFDISEHDNGDRVWSKKYQDSTSSYNVCEAEHIADMVERFLLFNRIPKGGRRAHGRDIMIISGYWGQNRMLEREILAKRQAHIAADGSDPMGWADIKIMSHIDAQGWESEIVFVSFCKNDPLNVANLGFIYDKHMLNVELTRAKSGLCMTGTFQKWLEGWANGDLAGRNEWKPFVDLVLDLYNRRDLVAECDWRHGTRAGGTIPSKSTFYSRMPNLNRQAGPGGEVLGATPANTPAVSRALGGNSGGYGSGNPPGRGPGNNRGGGGGGKRKAGNSTAATFQKHKYPKK